jgi:peptidyl-prolyl cis-trans isomerase SurA
MKKVFIICAAALFTNTLCAQTLFTYGKNETSKADFLRAYNKNKPSTTDKEKAMREYLDLYTNFKLKVKAAQELRLDTISQIKYDVENFREQVLENYLSDEKGMQLLIDEAMTRASKDVHVLYFSVPVSKEATTADTMKAYIAAKELCNNLKKGNSYNEIVTDISSNFFPAKYADVGYVTAFTVPYEFENIIYNTKEGGVSEPYKTAKGWNIFKVVEDRPAIGKWKVAQILLAYPPSADNATKLAIKAKADSVHNLLKNGLGFAEAAKLYSDDRMTYLSGGEIQEFGTGKFNSTFETNVIALKNDNDFGKPFETAFGCHIVKRLTHTAVPTNKSDGTYQFETKQKVVQDSRINNEREKFAKDVMQKTGFKKAASISDKTLFADIDSLLVNPSTEKINKLPLSKKPIASFKDGTQVKGGEWLKFVMDNQNLEQPKQPNNVLWNKFAKQTVINYYKKHLEEYNADFKYQMQEFKEGNMLFEIMERNVWSKSGTDSVSLKKYYEAHKENYKWTASTDVLIFNCATEKLATEALAASKAGKTWAAIAETSNTQIQTDSGRYEVAQIPGASSQGVRLSENTYSDITKNTDGSASFVKYVKLYNANMQRSFSEARGLVINDYQNVLEQQWVGELKKKYPVKVNEVVFKEMVK